MSSAPYKRSFHGKALIANPHHSYGCGKNHTYACSLLGFIAISMHAGLHMATLVNYPTLR